MRSVTKALVLMMLPPTSQNLSAPSAAQNGTGPEAWIFFGVAALIVVAQLVPMIMVFLEMIIEITQKRSGAFKKSSGD